MVAVADVGDHRDARRKAALVDELTLDLEQGRLALVDENQPLAADAGDLPAELRSDRPTRAGDEHRLVDDVRRHRFEIHLDLLSPENVLDLDRAELPAEVDVAGNELVQPWERLDGDAFGARRVDDTLPCLTRSRRHRDEHLVRVLLAQDAAQIVGPAENADAVHAKPLLPRIVVDETDRRRPCRRRLQHLLDDHLGRVACADDDHFLPTRNETLARRALEDRPGEHPRSRDEGEQEQPVHDGDRPRQADLLVRGNEVDDEARDEACHGDAAHRRPHVARRDVAPPAVVEAEEDEDAELDDDHDRQRAPQERLVVGRDLRRVEAQAEREVPRHGDEDCVGGELPQAVAVDHRAAPTCTAARTVSTTRVCVSASIPAQSGNARFSRAARSVSGSDPSSQPRYRSDGWRCRGVT